MLGHFWKLRENSICKFLYFKTGECTLELLEGVLEGRFSEKFVRLLGSTEKKSKRRKRKRKCKVGKAQQEIKY